MASSVLISLIFATKGKQPEAVRQGIASAAGALTPESELIFIDQNPDRAMKPLFEAIRGEHPDTQMRYEAQGEQGLSKARNLGLRLASGKWIVLCDDDAIYPQDFVARIRQELEKFGSKDFRCLYGTAFALETRKPYVKRGPRLARMRLWSFDTACSIELVLHRETLLSVGGFDESFGAGSQYPAGEEADVLIRFLEKGYPILRAPSFEVYHPQWVVEPTRKYQYGFGLGALYRKHISKNPVHALVFGMKFSLETLLRTALGIAGYFKAKGVAESHFNYLRGFYDGFASWKKSDDIAPG